MDSRSSVSIQPSAFSRWPRCLRCLFSSKAPQVAPSVALIADR
ncbi:MULTISPECIES: hypothetical protein [Moorena]|nr:MULTISPECIES: hypothetical protein [Moorena]